MLIPSRCEAEGEAVPSDSKMKKKDINAITTAIANFEEEAISECAKGERLLCTFVSVGMIQVCCLHSLNIEVIPKPRKTK